MASPRQHVGVGRTSLTVAVSLLALMLVLAFAAVACGDDGDSGGADTATIVGVWEDTATGETFEFTADGKFVSEATEGLNMTYTVAGNEITFNSEFGSGETTEFILDGDTLQIENAQTGEFETLERVN